MLEHGRPDLLFYYRIEPLRELSREHTFYLSLKAGVFERPISQPVTLCLGLHLSRSLFVLLLPLNVLAVPIL
jgi:hypothetical protein